MLRFLYKAKEFFLYYFYVIKNRNVDYFDYEKLSKNYPIFCLSDETAIIGNKCYGNKQAIKNALKEEYDDHCMIEHGVYFARFVIENECLSTACKIIYTYSDYRKESIENYFKGDLKKKIVTLGPYIRYANNFKSKIKRDLIKKHYGSILLVFPTHASPEVSTNYDFDLFLSRIDEAAKDYDSVFISMFWLDIVKGNHLPYQKRGYIIVCSGTRSDPRFLNRQRDLIELADMSMSNDIGTHIGYCICLGTPHYIFTQEISTNGLPEYDAPEYDAEYKVIRNKEYKEISEAFSCFTPIITDVQLRIIKKYWGNF